MIGIAPSYFGLTIRQISRAVQCQLLEAEKGRMITLAEIGIVIDDNVTSASRVAQKLYKTGVFDRARKGRIVTYGMSRKWRLIAYYLKRNNLLPDRCAIDGCENVPLTFRYRKRFLCRDHMNHCGCDLCPQRDTHRCAIRRNTTDTKDAEARLAELIDTKDDSV